MNQKQSTMAKLKIQAETLRRRFTRGALANALREASYAHNSVRSWGPPKILEMELTSHCARQCIMCQKKYSFSRTPAHMPLDLYRQIIDQLVPWHQVMWLGGPPIMSFAHYGEPCLYPHLYEAIRACTDRGFRTWLSATAAQFTPARAEAAVEGGLSFVRLMLEGMDEETSTKIRGKAASFQKSVDNIEHLLEYKRKRGLSYPEIRVAMIRQPANAHQWQAFLDYWGQVEGVRVELFCLSNHRGNPEVDKLLKQLQAMNGQPEWDAHSRFLDRYRCAYPWHSVSVLQDGSVVPCCCDMNGDYVLGNLQKNPLAEIWNDEPIRALRAELISGQITNPLCSPCNEANSEIELPKKFYPGFAALNKLFPSRYSRARE